VTLESPIEFLFRDINSSITQREVGSDTESFVAGLGAALRQDPDVISIGDLRDAATADAALAAAEVGHLVISTVHATNAATTVSRAVALFPPEDQEPARLRLAETLRAVVVQRLIPRADGHGRCAVVEVMISTPEIRRHIRERRSVELREAVSRGRELYGMQTFEQHLEDLVESGVVAPDVAHGVRGEMGGEGDGGYG
jgi:twitching motility protein PilT